MTRAAQLVAFVALISAAAALLLPRSRPTAPGPSAAPEASGVGVTPVADTEPPAPEPEDWAALAETLGAVRTPLADPQGQVADTAPSGESDQAQAEPADTIAAGSAPPTEPAPPGWQYVGYARDPSGAYIALLSFTGKQRFVRPGSTVDAFTVESIAPDAVIVTRDGRRFSMALASPGVYDPAAAVRAQQRDAEVRGRNAQLEQQRLRDLEAERARRAAESSGQGGAR
ncbi:MAG: hypothetical protein D6693_04215 [Planctomycetota bacterium]|nr:MAG: hypothetical protein D6693_04215 [Planctomycetota bacterium]